MMRIVTFVGVFLLTLALLTLQSCVVSAGTWGRSSNTRAHDVATRITDKLADFKLLPQNYFYESKQLRPADVDDDYDYEEEEEDEQFEEELHHNLNEEAGGGNAGEAAEFDVDGDNDDEEDEEGDEGDDGDGDDEEQRHLRNMETIQRFMQDLLRTFH